MRVFNIQDGKITLNESITLLPVVKELSSLEYNAKYPKDSEGRGRKRWEAELKYVFDRYSLFSPYKSWREEDKIARAFENAGFPDKWKESEQLKVFITVVQEFEVNTDTKRALKAVRGMLLNLIKHIEGVDFDEVNDKGGNKYDVKKYVAMASDVRNVLEEIKLLEAKADAEDKLGEERRRGNVKKGKREDVTKTNWEE